MYRLEQVSKSYGATTVLHPISIQIQSGHTTALIGPSGCGKTTVLRLLTGLVLPDEGVIYFDDHEIGKSDWELVRQKIGYVIQGGGLFPHLTAMENIALAANCTGWTQNKIATRIDELCQLVRMSSEQIMKYPKHLSGGQSQRVSLMRALMLDPRVLLLDEPLGALDPLIRFELQDELREIFRSLGTTVVMVTHDLSEAAYLADQIVLLNAGHVEQVGSPNEILQRPQSAWAQKFVRSIRKVVN